MRRSEYVLLMKLVFLDAYIFKLGSIFYLKPICYRGVNHWGKQVFVKDVFKVSKNPNILI